jgi:hypothetical protein
MAPLFHQWYSVLSLVILDADEDLFPFACYENVIFLEYIDGILCEDQNCAVVQCLAHNVSACLDYADSLQKGSWVTYLALLVLPLATPTCRVDGLRIGRPALHRSCSLM